MKIKPITAVALLAITPLAMADAPYVAEIAYGDSGWIQLADVRCPLHASQYLAVVSNLKNDGKAEIGCWYARWDGRRWSAVVRWSPDNAGAADWSNAPGEIVYRLGDGPDDVTLARTPRPLQ